MCRWMAYSGASIALAEVLLETEISLIDQSLSARRSVEPTNGDGFGVGWYGRAGRAGLYRAIQPAWNDENLRDLAAQVESGLFLAHVRRSTGTPVQRTNCHPFRHDKWLFVHNGEITGFRRIKRELVLAINPELFPLIGGSTDSELMFFLALSYGLEEDPFRALEEMAAVVERIGREAGIEHPLQMSLGLADGERLLAVRYSSEGCSRTLFYNQKIDALRELYPSSPRLANIPSDARAVVSEPLNDVSDAWIEVPESCALSVARGEVELRSFTPRLPGVR